MKENNLLTKNKNSVKGVEWTLIKLKKMLKDRNKINYIFKVKGTHKIKGCKIWQHICKKVEEVVKMKFF